MYANSIIHIIQHVYVLVHVYIVLLYVFTPPRRVRVVHDGFCPVHSVAFRMQTSAGGRPVIGQGKDFEVGVRYSENTVPVCQLYPLFRV